MLEYIGKINKDKLGKYKDMILTTDVVLTYERKNHIYNEHIKDFKIIMKNLTKVVENPREILDDSKNENTIFLIDSVLNNNLNVVIKLNVVNDNKHPKNSVMTAWIIRDSNLKKIRKKNKIIYKRE